VLQLVLPQPLQQRLQLPALQLLEVEVVDDEQLLQYQIKQSLLLQKEILKQ